jgi:Predicted pPIWI-associating nuclease
MAVYREHWYRHADDRMTRMDDDARQIRRRIAEAVQKTEVTLTEAWQELNLLSSNTQIDTIEIFENEIRIDADRFEGPLTWYVVLRYGAGTSDPVETSESFPGSFEGRLVDNAPIIDSMTVDTSSFYA